MSGTVIITKFSDSNSAPITNALAKAEQAYSYSSNKLWIGESQVGGIEAVAIGGVFFTDQLKSASAQFGSVTANQAIVTGSNNKIDLINIDNITIDGNTISTTNTNGTLIVDPNGNGSISLHANTDVVGNLTVSGTTTLTDQLTVSSMNVTDLTNDRVIISGPSGELEDSANLTFNGTTLTITGVVDADNVRIDGNTISATNADGSITITPNGNGYAKVDADTALIIPSGVDGTRPNAATIGNAAIRYNETTNRFEGVVSSNWTGLGGVVDIDQDTYIVAEEAADEDTLRFYTAGNQELYINDNGLYVTEQITTPTANITTANTTTANIGTITVSTQMDVNADANFSAGIDVTAGDVDITDNLNVGGNTVVSGNLTVNGTTTTIESTVTTLNDPVIKVGAGSSTTVDLIDRGVNFDYGDGTAVKTGFFGFDNATNRFSYKPIVDTADEDYVAPWGDAQFGSLFLRGTLEAGANGNLVITDNGITLTSGDLTIAPAGGDTNITGDLNVSAALEVTSTTTLSNTLDVTGATTLNNTLNVVNAADFDSTLNVDGTVTLKNNTSIGSSGQMVINSYGVMTAGTIDGGTF